MLPPGGGNFLSWSPRRVDAVEARVGAAVARWLQPRTAALAAIRFAGAPVTMRVVRTGAVAVDPDGAVAVVRGGPEPVLVIGGGGLVRGLAQAVLGGPAELPAPRPPTVAEQAVWALAVAAGLDAIGGALAVEPSRIAPAMVRGEAMLELAVDAIARGPAWIALPAAVLDRPAPPAPLAALADRAGWLDAATLALPVVIAHAAVSLDELARLAPRDVIVVGAIGGAGLGSLRVGRGELAVSLEPGADRVTVAARYQRGCMDETLGEDLTVELAVSTGTVAVTARALLELAPGAVLSLARPADGRVELVVGRRVIGTGELIEVDGELAVRVLALRPAGP